MTRSKLLTLRNIVEGKCTKLLLPFERVDPNKKLKNFCLEFCARNFEEIFMAKQDDKVRSLREGISLPPFIFEEIHEKSRKLGCCIKPHLLRTCLGFRAALNWQYIDLIYIKCEVMPLRFIDLRCIAKDKTPVKKLTFCSNEEITEKWLLCISKFASTLEHLSIGPDDRDLEAKKGKHDAKAEWKLRLNKVEMPNLKFLKLSFCIMSASILEMIDVHSFKDSLKVLRLRNYHHWGVKNKSNSNFDIELLRDMITKCKNVTSLSLSHGHFSKEEGNLLFEAIRTLKELRDLDLFRLAIIDSSKSFNLDFTAPLPKLESLDVSYTHFYWKNLSSLEGVHLKYFGGFLVVGLRIDKIGHMDNFEGHLSSHEYSERACRDHSSEEVLSLESLALMWLFDTSGHSLTVHERVRLERFIKSRWSRYPHCSQLIAVGAMILIKKPDWCPYWSNDFMAMAIRYYVNFRQIHH